MSVISRFALEIDNCLPLRHSGGMVKPALGRGLSALLGGAPTVPKSPIAPFGEATGEPPVTGNFKNDQVLRIPIKQIYPCSLQPRKSFQDAALNELADSIREQGIVQPLIVRARGADFELIAGERRWRAAQILGLAEVPAIVRQADDRAVLELALIENLQRENLNPIEEALGYEQLIGQFGLTQEEVATKVGKSRAVVANALRLLKLPEDVRNYIRDGRLSVGHAKVVLGLGRSEEQNLAVERILKGGLSVRQTEDLIANWQPQGNSRGASDARRPEKNPVDANTARLQERLQERFGTKVQLRYRQGKGAVEIRFFNDTDFERILDLLGMELE